MGWRLRPCRVGTARRVRAVDRECRCANYAGDSDWGVMALQWYKLMPGMDALRRRGRVDGWVEGGRASVPAIVWLDGVPGGNALRDARGWRPLPDDKPFDRSKDGLARLWISRPAEAETAEWVLFEGARPAAPYGVQGSISPVVFLDLGETLFCRAQHIQHAVRSGEGLRCNHGFGSGRRRPYRQCLSEGEVQNSD